MHETLQRIDLMQILTSCLFQTCRHKFCSS